MKTFSRSIVFLIVFCLIAGEASTFGQAIPNDTGDFWPQAINEGLDAYRLKEFPKAEDAFRRAEAALPASLTGSMPHCLTRMLLAETCVELSKPNEAERLTDEVVLQLRKASRPVNLKNCSMTGKTNIYRFQTGAALYLRAARLYVRINQYDKGERLFEPALELFRNPIVIGCAFLVGGQAPSRASRQLEPNPALSSGAQSDSTVRTFYPMRHLRRAAIHEAECRFHLVRGLDDQALMSLQQAEKVRKEATADKSAEMFVDQLIVEPLDKSLLKRFLEDCAFYSFDDARIAVLLDRQAALLKKVGRTDEATAFERFAKSLRRRPPTP
jgi:tetratricopeptide (TPR) repeat protein